jgi:DNA mismatch repair ATPase MutS
MAFLTDKQTLEDLNVFGKHGDHALFTVYNTCVTRGGAEVMEQMFRSPLSKHEDINIRSGIIDELAQQQLEFPFKSGTLDAVSSYLGQRDERTRLSDSPERLMDKVNTLFFKDIETETIYTGIQALVGLLKDLRRFSIKVSPDRVPSYSEDFNAISKVLDQKDFVPIFEKEYKSGLKKKEYIYLDSLLRFRHADSMEKLLHLIYRLDVFLAVGRVALKNGYNRAEAYPSGKSVLRMDGLGHPNLPKAKTNSLHLAQDENVIFLTGANMAGKSTFMKALGIAMYLAHMGFPVPAKRFDFSAMDGMFMTINLADDIDQGESHFYAEVLRLKKVARHLADGKNVFVLFDELFRGTNVKDAYDGTLEVVRAFQYRPQSVLLLSTHIVEVGQVLQEETKHVHYVYLPTHMVDNTPHFTYKLTPGITTDRHGMLILIREGVLGLLGQSHKSFEKQDLN